MNVAANGGLPDGALPKLRAITGGHDAEVVIAAGGTAGHVVRPGRRGSAAG